jgi:dihydroceramide fatty acyl 2-hydroxylase
MTFASYPLLFVTSVVLSTFVEYWFHRLVLHAKAKTWLTVHHKRHHKENRAGGILTEFILYVPLVLPFAWVGFLHDWTGGVVFVSGGVLYALFLAVAHKLSHEAPQFLFWMNPNVHHLHHEYSPKYNYGVTSHVWDIVFRTYRASGSETTGPVATVADQTGSGRVPPRVPRGSRQFPS